MKLNIQFFAAFFTFYVLSTCQSGRHIGEESSSQAKERKLPMWISVEVKRKGEFTNPRMNIVDGEPFTFRVEDEYSSKLLKMRGHHKGKTVQFDLTVENKRKNAPDFLYVLNSEELKWGEKKTATHKMQDGSVVETSVMISEGQLPGRR